MMSWRPMHRSSIDFERLLHYYGIAVDDNPQHADTLEKQNAR